MKKDESKKKLAFVVHEENQVPRYYEVKKSLLKLFIIILPTLSLLSVSAAIFFIISTKRPSPTLSPTPSQITPQSTPIKVVENKNPDEQITLSEELSSLKKINQELEKKLTSTSTSSLDILNLLKFTSGQTDLSKQTNIKTEGTPPGQPLLPLFDTKQIHLKFNLINLSEGGVRHSGHLFVVMKTSDMISIYPQGSFDEKYMHIIYNRGEAFSFNKLRFVQATFERPLNPGKISFKILLFNKTGDLIYQESIYTENKEPRP